MPDFPGLHPSTTQETPDPNPPAAVLLHGGGVANWMWEPQLRALKDFTGITPDLPGHGARAAEEWPGLEKAADDVVTRVRELGVTEPFHLVGLSLGGVVATHVAARHPEALASTLITGANLVKIGGIYNLMVRAQAPFMKQQWFWRSQAKMMKLDAEAETQFVEHALTLRKDSIMAMYRDVFAAEVPESLADYKGRFLAIAGEKEPKAITDSFAKLIKAMAQAETRVAPGLPHVWNVEDPDFFNSTLSKWVNGKVEERLLPA